MNLFDIELMSVGIYTGVKYMVLEHDFRNISVRIVFRDVNLKPEHSVTPGIVYKCHYLNTPSWYGPCLMNRTPNQRREELAEGIQ